MVHLRIVVPNHQAGIGTLYVQRRLYQRRRRRHLRDSSREIAGLPVGRSRRARPDRQPTARG